MPFDPSQQVVGLTRRTGEACFMPQTGGPPLRIDGYTVGAPIITHDPPHDGEMHPNGDELLFVMSGRFDVTLELDAGHHDVELRAGEGLVVPRGVWHLVSVRNRGGSCTSRPGGGEHRPWRGGSDGAAPGPAGGTAKEQR